MPHKHTRRPGKPSGEDFNLPPTVQAHSLSVHKPAAPTTDTASKGKKRKRRQGDLKDDTPREFKRLMQMQAHMVARKQGLPSTKRTSTSLPAAKQAKPHPSTQRQPQHTLVAATEEASTTDDPQADDIPAPSAKVHSSRRPYGLDDPSLLLPRTSTKDIAALRQPKSHLQKKIDRKLATWHEQDTKMRSAAAERAAVRREEEGERVGALLAAAGVKVGVDEEEGLVEFGLGGWKEDVVVEERDKGAVKEVGGGRKQGRRKKREDVEDRAGKTVEKRAKWGLGDVVQAPPELKRVREVLKAKNSGSASDGQRGLKEKADLSEARAEVIRRYREMMGKSRGL